MHTQPTPSQSMRGQLFLQQVGLHFDSNKLDVLLDFSLGTRIGSLCLDDNMCTEARLRMQQLLDEEFDSVSPMQYIEFLDGEHHSLCRRKVSSDPGALAVWFMLQPFHTGHRHRVVAEPCSM